MSDQTTVIQSAPRPKTQTQLKQLLGLAGFCRQWIPGYSSISAPLEQLLTTLPYLGMTNMIYCL